MNHIQGGPDQMTTFEMAAIHSILQIFEWNKKYSEAKDGKMGWEVTRYGKLCLINDDLQIESILADGRWSFL